MLAQLARAERICLCVVDSDKNCPAGALGATAQSVSKYKEMSIYPLIGVMETTGRELENVCPDSFFFNKYGKHAIYSAMATMLAALTAQGEVEVRAHIDIKHGLTLQNVFELEPGSAGAIFWTDKLASTLTAAGVDMATLPCLTFATCRNKAKSQCGCVVAAGIGSRPSLLEEFTEFCANIGVHVLSKSLDNSVSTEWLRVGSAVASWCCGDSRLRI